ncbi:hypothetical protein CAPTEDRAFT_219745 [Capitella teleta]|uniref:Uncharacterized protein n=1 Tax=Capitella teleta TaxID=283909 RepID=R7UM10_CAPTE|nr:hypothetical protein CAPTEDRAFT_219745 [Capitella teleta]|eukprot:ELU07544.1 hypothetical protein CAPTEDRAFT_219745 [Capitella teleta]
MARSGGWKTLIPCRKTPKSKRQQTPVNHAGLFSFLTLSWLDAFMWRAFRKKLLPDEMWTCPPQDGVHFTRAEFLTLWEAELASRGKDAKLSSVLWKYVRKRLVISVFILFAALAGLLFMAAFLMNTILMATWRTDSDVWLGVALAASLFCLNMVNCILFVAPFSLMQIAGSRARNGCLGLLYGNIIHSSQIPEKSLGKILNVFASDGQRLYDGISLMPMLFGGPALIFAGTGIAVYLLGPMAILGAVITLFLFPLQGIAGKCFMKFRAEAVVLTDKRVRQMTEYISNMKFIKMYTWEKPIAKILKDLRQLERRTLEKVNMALSVAFITAGMVVAMATMLTLMAFVLSGHQLNGVTAFTYVILYASIQEKMELTSMAIKAFSEYFVASNRIQNALLLTTSESGVVQHPQPSDYVVEMNNASFSWPQTKSIFSEEQQEIQIDQNQGETEKLNPNGEGRDKRVLSHIDLNVSKGDVVGIVGTVGSGKTALLSAILGQMEMTEGEAFVSGSFAYVPQQAWIFNSTLRENILLGSAMEQERYEAIVTACCLKPDLEALPAADLTEIGEKGINLSGGQKQRISLARAMYADRQIYLLDDPLAAVDPDVAQNIYKNLIQEMMLGKTVLFVTNKIKFLEDCDKVVCLNGGEIEEQGPPEELRDLQGLYAGLVELREKGKSGGLGLIILALGGYEERQGSRVGDLKEEEIPKEVKNLTSEEEKAEGAVSWKTYASYVNGAGGMCALYVVLVLALLAEGAKAFSYWWLAVWIRANAEHAAMNINLSKVDDDNVTYEGLDGGRKDDLWKYHLTYGMTMLAILLLYLIRSVILAKFLVKASTKLHNWLLEKVLRCPMAFFDMTPLGRILNRFSRDLDELDSRLPPLVDCTLRTVVSLVLYLILIGLIAPWVLIGVPVIFAVFILLYCMFRVGTREFKRHQLISLSPLLSHVNASLEGLPSIRAYNKEADFYEKLTTLLDTNSVWLDVFNFTMRWLNIRLSIVTSAMLSLTCLIVFLVKDDLPMEFAGTAILYAIQLLSLTQLFMRFAVESEATFTSAERICSYMKTLEAEGKDKVQRYPPPDFWPSKGDISFKDFNLRYRKDSPFVLHDVTLDIADKEKIGIVGRTGSGKSTLVNALFRLVEETTGALLIDGVEASSVELPVLRSQISIIPQDPVMFSGTLRSNLDPLKRHIDMEIWRELEKCHVKDLVQSLDNKLDAEVREGGRNFSTGEKQLLCMATVLLQRTKILILDEATAAIDVETSHKIHSTLMEEFSDTTVLIIAHRLETVQRCDKILVLEGGRVLEYDRPDALLNDETSHFHRMMIASNGPRGSSSHDTNVWV